MFYFYFPVLFDIELDSFVEREGVDDYYNMTEVTVFAVSFSVGFFL